jgi:hypothetical protein
MNGMIGNGKTGFGLVFIKGEGCPIHPDDPMHGYFGDDEDLRKKLAFRYYDCYPNQDWAGCSYFDEWLESKEQ